MDPLLGAQEARGQGLKDASLTLTLGTVSTATVHTVGLFERVEAASQISPKTRP